MSEQRGGEGTSGYRPSYEQLWAELRERISSLEEDAGDGRQQIEDAVRDGLNAGEPAFRHMGEALASASGERTEELLERRHRDLADLLERRDSGAEPPIPDWW